MRNIPGTITDRAMDSLIDGNNHAVAIDALPPGALTLSAYQEAAASTAIYPRVYTEDQVRAMLLDISQRGVKVGDDAIEGAIVKVASDAILDRFETDFSRLVYPVLGLLGETGEIANKLKKVARDGKGMQTDEQTAEIVKEIGDVQWYVAAIATETKTNLGTIALDNLKKLFSRKQRGVLGGSGDNR